MNYVKNGHDLKRPSAKKDPRCPHCKGQFASEGVETKKLPLGFGFAESAKFQVDFVVVKSYFGFCLDCGKKGTVEFSRRRGRSFPRSINRKLRKQVNQ